MLALIVAGLELPLPVVDRVWLGMLGTEICLRDAGNATVAGAYAKIVAEHAPHQSIVREVLELDRANEPAVTGTGPGIAALLAPLSRLDDSVELDVDAEDIYELAVAEATATTPTDQGTGDEPVDTDLSAPPTDAPPTTPAMPGSESAVSVVPAPELAATAHGNPKDDAELVRFREEAQAIIRALVTQQQAADDERRAAEVRIAVEPIAERERGRVERAPDRERPAREPQAQVAHSSVAPERALAATHQPELGVSNSGAFDVEAAIGKALEQLESRRARVVRRRPCVDNAFDRVTRRASSGHSFSLPPSSSDRYRSIAIRYM